MKLIFLLILVMGLAACQGNRDPKLSGFHFPYKLDMHQGNEVSDADLAKLKVGMYKQQVEEIIGSPLLVDTFKSNRWDYVQMDRLARKKMTRKKVSLFFVDEKLAQVRR